MSQGILGEPAARQEMRLRAIRPLLRLLLSRRQKIKKTIDGTYSGEDPAKADHHEVYVRGHVAEDVMDGGLCKYAPVQPWSPIGMTKPLPFFAGTYGMELHAPTADNTMNIIKIVFDIRPGVITLTLTQCEPKLPEAMAYDQLGRESNAANGAKFLKGETANDHTQQAATAQGSSDYLSE